jgi:hypothetical protein
LHAAHAAEVVRKVALEEEVYASTYVTISCHLLSGASIGYVHRINHNTVIKSEVETFGLSLFTTTYVNAKMTEHPAANMLQSSSVFHSLAR